MFFVTPVSDKIITDTKPRKNYLFFTDQQMLIMKENCMERNHEVTTSHPLLNSQRKYITDIKKMYQSLGNLLPIDWYMHFKRAFLSYIHSGVPDGFHEITSSRSHQHYVQALLPLMQLP